MASSFVHRKYRSSVSRIESYIHINEMELAKQKETDGIEGDGLSRDGMGEHRERSDDLELNELKSNPW